MVRAPCFDSNGMKKGAWSEEEDNILRAFVMRYGHWNWRLLPKYAGLARCGKSCRLRWMNHLKPGVKRGNFSKEEEDLITKLHAQLGNKWSAIATKLPGRTDNDIKNYWHAHINKRREKWHNTEACSKQDRAIEEKKASAFTLCKTTQNESTSLDDNSLIKIQQSSLSCDTNSSFLPVTEPEVDLWPDIFVEDTNYSQNVCLPPLLDEEFSYPQLHYSELSSADSSYMSGLDWIADDNHSIISSECVAQPVQGSFWSECFSTNTSNSENGSSYVASPQEVGGIYDPLIFQYFDYGINSFS